MGTHDRSTRSRQRRAEDGLVKWLPDEEQARAIDGDDNQLAHRTSHAGARYTPARNAGHDFANISAHGQTTVRIQPKLAVAGREDDAEREANRVATQLV